MKWETYVRAQDLKLDRQLGSGIPQGAERPIITNSNLTEEIFLKQMAFKQEKIKPQYLSEIL